MRIFGDVHLLADTMPKVITLGFALSQLEDDGTAKVVVVAARRII